MPPSSGKQQWKLILAYDGTEFHGWQAQPGCSTVQGTLAEAIAGVTGERVLPQGSGRTDAGVHASGQVASFPLAAPIPPANLQRALNRLLPAAIRVLAAERVPADFHARHSALCKFYRYRIFPGEVCPPFLARYVASCRWPLDLDRMQQAAAAILGEHDFTSFAASDPDRMARLADSGEEETDDLFKADLGSDGGWDVAAKPSNVRIIYRSEWSQIPLNGYFGPAEEGLSSGDEGSETPGDPVCGQAGLVAGGQPGILRYTVCGNGFLHHMVRNLVGTLIEVGRGRLAASCIPEILQARDRALAGPTALARGLCLEKVGYTGTDC